MFLHTLDNARWLSPSKSCGPQGSDPIQAARWLPAGDHAESTRHHALQRPASPCGHRTGRTFASLRPVEPVIRGIVGDPDVGREPGVPERAPRPPPPIWPPDSAEPPGRPQLGLTVPPRRAVLRWLRVFGGS